MGSENQIEIQSNQNEFYEAKPQTNKKQSEESDVRVTRSDYENYSSQDRQPQSFDDVLTKIGFGQYNIALFVLMGLIGMTDGAEAQNLSLVLPIMEQKSVFGIKDSDEGILGSVVFAGYFLGSFISGKIADTFGRKPAIQYSSILLFIFSVASSISPSFATFVTLRAIFGVLVGFVCPVSFSILAENIPVKQRGAMLVCIGVFYTLGELLTCFLALITMKNLREGNWRLMLALNSIPAFLLMIGSFLFLQESPRFLMIKGKQKEAFDIMNKIGSTHKNKYSLNEEDKQDLQHWAEQTNSMVQDDGDLKSLFQGKFKYVTPIIWYNWFVASFVYFGITFILPLTLNDGSDSQQDDLWTLTIASLGELPTILIVAIAVHVPFLGRKNTWAISYGIGFIALVLVYFEVNFVFFVTVSKLALDMAFTISYEYTGEIYPTRHRAKGLGMAGAYSRIGGILMPWIGIYISKVGKYLPYLIFGISSGLASVITFFLPFETRNMDLDRFQ